MCVCVSVCLCKYSACQSNTRLTLEKRTVNESGSIKAYISRSYFDIHFPIKLFEVTGDLSLQLSSMPSGSGGKIPCLILLDEELDTFKLLVEWAHATKEGELHAQGPLKGVTSDNLVKLYVLAHQYKITKLQDAVMRALFKDSRSRDWGHCEFLSNKSSLDRLVEKVPQGSKMHEFLVDYLVNSSIQAPTSNAEKLIDNIPDQVVRLAFKKIFELPECSCSNRKGTDANDKVDDYLLGSAD